MTSMNNEDKVSPTLFFPFAGTSSNHFKKHKKLTGPGWSTLHAEHALAGTLTTASTATATSVIIHRPEIVRDMITRAPI
jgi:hypothetical protein